MPCPARASLIPLLLAALASGCDRGIPPREAQFRVDPDEARRLDSADLFAGPITPDNAARRLVGGPHAIGGIGDWALGNGVVCAVVSAPEHEAILTEGGGVLVDLGHCGRADDQWAVLQLHMFNLSPRRIAPVDAIEAAVEGDTARLVTRGALQGIEVETSYVLDAKLPDVLRVTSRLRRVAPGERLFMLGDTALHGRRSLAPFVISRPWPWISQGFDHPDADPNDIGSIIAAIHPADLHVLVGSEDDGPGISYGLLLDGATLVTRDGGRRALSSLALNGADYTLQGVFTRPLWIGGRSQVGLLQFAQTPFMRLRTGETLEVRRALIVSDRADVAGVTDRLLTDAPRVTGWMDDPGARLHVDERNALGLWSAFTVARPDPYGRFAFRAPRGRYRLRVLAPGQALAETDFAVDARDVALGVLETEPLATLRLPRDWIARLVFLGLDDTPDPVFRDDGLAFRSGGRLHRNAAASRDVVLAGAPGDPETVSLAAGRYRVIATRGPEWEVSETAIEVTAGETHVLALPPLLRAFDTPGWIAADLHVHTGRSFDSSLAPATQVRAFAAQGGEVLVSTEHDYVADHAPVIAALGLDDRLASVVGAELTSTARTERLPFTGGHSNLFPLRPKPLDYRNGAPRGEGRRLREVVAAARRAGPDTLVQLNHPRPEGESDDLETDAYFTHLAVAGRPFRPELPLDREPNALLLEPDPATRLRDLDFELIEVMNGASRWHYRRARADWLSLLLQGEPRTATANSDSHGRATPVALPRTWVRVDDDRPAHFDAEAFVAALRAHRAIGSSGPFLDLDLGGAGPGETFTGTSGLLRVRVEAATWAAVSALRVRVNGRLEFDGRISPPREQSLALQFDRDAVVTVEVEGEPSEIFEALLPGGAPLAFANPIFVDADGDGRWSPPGLPGRRLDVLSEPDRTP